MQPHNHRGARLLLLPQRLLLLPKRLVLLLVLVGGGAGVCECLVAIGLVCWGLITWFIHLVVIMRTRKSRLGCSLAMRSRDRLRAFEEE